MFINKILSYTQNYLHKFYLRSLILQNLDWLIFFNVILVIFTSTFLPSDNIGYFAIFTIILTSIKLFTKKNEKFYISKAEVFLLLFFIITLISVAGSTLIQLSLKGFFKTIIYIGFYISTVNLLKSNKSMIKYILFTIALCAIGESFIAFKQNFLSVSEISGWQDVSRLNPEQIMTRVYGSLKPYNPNLFGGYLLSVLPTILIMVVLPFKNKFYKTAALGLIFYFMTSIALFLTGCRGAYIGFFAQILILSIIIYKIISKNYRKIFLYIISALTTISVFIICSLPQIKTRILSIFAMRSDSSNSFRFNVYNSCIEMFKDNWLLGIGVGNQNFREIYGLYMKTGFDELSAYNIYLETAVESGIFALITFLIFLYLNIEKSIKYVLNHNNIKSVYLIIATASLIGILAHGFVDTVFFRPQIQFTFWIMLSIIRVLTIKESRYKLEK